jgi:acyl-CoA thioester hydrolase
MTAAPHHHDFLLRIYYEDTDAGGIVYYANYLKFAERARTEWLRSHGIEQHTLRQTHQIGFVVSHASIRYHAPAILDDMLRMETHLQAHRKVRMSMRQLLYRDATLLTEIDVELACVNAHGVPCKIPEIITTALAKSL